MTEELEKYKKEAEEYLNNWKRERADFINYKKDEAKRLEEFAKFANEALILEMIEVIDDMEKAAKEVKNEGLNQVLKKFQDLLKKYGVERIEAKGAFDPLLHEAVASRIEGQEQVEEMKELRAGYKMNGKVIRPARVSIQKIIINK